MNTATASREMKLTRLINAPREKVFKAWVNKDELQKWWGPKGFTNPVCEIDAKPGGNILIHMKAPDGAVYPMDGMFHEIVEPEKIVFTSAALDKNGRRLFEVLNTVTFLEENGKTKVHIHAVVSNVRDEGRPYLEGMNQGWTQSIDRLEELTTGENSSSQAPLVFERRYKAPIEKVWKAITDVDQIRKWYFNVSGFKPEVGFEFQFNGVDANGKEKIHLCKVLEVVPLKKISHSWEYIGLEGTSVLTWELFNDSGTTIVKLTHAGLESFSNSGPGYKKENFNQGWGYFLDTALLNFLNEKK